MGWCGVSTAGNAPNRVALQHCAVPSDIGLSAEVDELRGDFSPWGGKRGEVCLGQCSIDIETVAEIVVLVGQATEVGRSGRLNEKIGDDIAAKGQMEGWLRFRGGTTIRLVWHM